jgi:hypothetical protein
VNLLASELDYVLCSHCKRPLLSKALQYHLELTCPNLQRDADKTLVEDDQQVSTNDIGEDIRVNLKVPRKEAKDIKKRRRLAESENESSSPAGSPAPKKARKAYVKKQKNEETGEEVRPGRKPRKDKQRPIPKTKLPVDVEKQCGVPLPNGILCARSLTCKTHSMGAKRAVLGRSAPYDVLLTQYQRKNQVKMASLSTAQQLADENEALGGAPVDPEEEVRHVMDGVRKTYVAPLDRAIIFPTRLKSQFFRMREMFASALLPKGSPTSGIGGIFGRATAFNPETPSNLHFVRPPALQRAAYLAAMRQQQQMRVTKQVSTQLVGNAPGNQESVGK